MFTCFHAVAHIPAFHIHIFMLVFTVYALFFRRLLLFCRILFYFHYFISRKFTGIDFVDISCLASFAICNTTEDDDGDAGGEREPLAVHIIHILLLYLYFAITVREWFIFSYFFYQRWGLEASSIRCHKHPRRFSFVGSSAIFHEGSSSVNFSRRFTSSFIEKVLRNGLDSLWVMLDVWWNFHQFAVQRKREFIYNF